MMDICEYAEKVLGLQLLDYQKTLLKQMHDYYEEHKKMPNIRVIPGCRGSSSYFHRLTLQTLALQMQSIAEMYDMYEKMHFVYFSDYEEGN